MLTEANDERSRMRVSISWMNIDSDLHGGQRSISSFGRIAWPSNITIGKCFFAKRGCLCLVDEQPIE